MISIRKYLDATGVGNVADSIALQRGEGSQRNAPGSRLMNAYRAALFTMLHCSKDACPTTGAALERSLLQSIAHLNEGMASSELDKTSLHIEADLKLWGKETARYCVERAAEVKQMLLVMANTARSVGEGDKRCSEQIVAVTNKLRGIASLDDLALIRDSIEASADELRQSVDRITEANRALLERLQADVSAFQERLSKAEEASSLDALTQLRSRLWVESQIEQRVRSQSVFSVAIVDLDGFKSVNDMYGHLAGDELLRQFSAELRSACRSRDISGRWGGDEFILVIDSGIGDAKVQLDRVRSWVCGWYSINRNGKAINLKVSATFGLAQFTPPETMDELLERADKDMYLLKEHKPQPRRICEA